MIGTCKLCEVEKEIKRSHIIPEFMYQNVYDISPKRFYIIKSDTKDRNKWRMRLGQKGIREKMLCGDCEVLLSKYENYASEKIYSKEHGLMSYVKDSIPVKIQQNFVYEYEGFSYPKFRIFLLSLLWRVIISESYFTPEINESLVEKLRKAILNQDPLEFDDFGCSIQVMNHKSGEIAGGFIINPFVTNSNTGIGLNILIDGFLYRFDLSSETIETEKGFLLKKDGKIKMTSKILSHDKIIYTGIKSAYRFLKTRLKEEHVLFKANKFEHLTISITHQ